MNDSTPLNSNPTKNLSTTQELGVVDVHAHAFPPSLLDFLDQQGYADLSGVSDGTLRLSTRVSGLASEARIPLPKAQYDLEERLESNAACGIDVQYVSAPPFVFGSMMRDAEEVWALVRASNDALADFVRGSSGQLKALGTVPIGIPNAPDELRRCIEELGMVGITIGTHGMGRELDDPFNEDLWRALEIAGCFCLMHPSRSSSPERFKEYHLIQLASYPMETALAASRLIFGGVLERNDIEVCLSHGGGSLLSIISRLDFGWKNKKEARTIPRAPSSYLENFQFDTTVFSQDELSALVRRVGSDKVLLGTDLPFELAQALSPSMVRSLDLDDEAIANILGGNARRQALKLRESTRSELVARS